MTLVSQERATGRWAPVRRALGGPLGGQGHGLSEAPAVTL